MSLIEVWRPLPQFKCAAGNWFECYDPSASYNNRWDREDE